MKAIGTDICENGLYCNPEVIRKPCAGNNLPNRINPTKNNFRDSVMEPVKQPSPHPLKMMPADYHRDDRHPFHVGRFRETPSRGFVHQSNSKGKGGRFPRMDSRVGQVDDFILPEMLTDPWIDLYEKLPDEVRIRETCHLLRTTEAGDTSGEALEESAHKRQNINGDP